MRHEENNEKRTAQRRAHYERENVNGKLVINLRDISHTLRDLSEGRGSQKRILILLLETGPITQRQRHPHGPHGKHGHHGSHSEWEGGSHNEAGDPNGRPHCNHDCQNCPNPCGKGRALRESR